MSLVPKGIQVEQDERELEEPPTRNTATRVAFWRSLTRRHCHSPVHQPEGFERQRLALQQRDAFGDAAGGGPRPVPPPHPGGGGVPHHPPRPPPPDPTPRS